MSSTGIIEIEKFKSLVSCSEIVRYRRYRVTTTAGSRRLTLEIEFLPTFPDDPPKIYLNSHLKHSWMGGSKFGEFIHAPGVLFWGVESRDAVRVLEQIIWELKKMLLPKLTIKQAYKTSDLNFLQINSIFSPDFNQYTVWELMVYVDIKDEQRGTKVQADWYNRVFQDVKCTIKDLVYIGLATEREAARLIRKQYRILKEMKMDLRINCRSKQYSTILELYEVKRLQLCFYRIASNSKTSTQIGKRFLAGKFPVELFLDLFYKTEEGEEEDDDYEDECDYDLY